MSKKESSPTVFSVCPVCGSLYPISGDEVNGCCGRQSCIDTLNKSRVVSTPIYGTNVNVITYVDGTGATVEEQPIINNTDANNVSITKDIDTREKDLENAKKIEKDFNKRFGKKTRKTTKKTKSRRISKTSK